MTTTEITETREPAATSTIAPVVAGLCLRRGTRGWRVVHTASGKHLPMVTWPTDELPQAAAEKALEILAGSGIDWTLDVAVLRADLRLLAAAVRAAGVGSRVAA